LKIAILKKSKNCFFLGKQADFYLNILLNIIRHWRGANEEGDICKFSVNLLSDIPYLQERKGAIGDTGLPLQFSQNFP